MSDKKPSLPVQNNPTPDQEPEYTGNALSFAFYWFGVPFILVVLIAALKMG